MKPHTAIIVILVTLLTASCASSVHGPRVWSFEYTESAKFNKEKGKLYTPRYFRNNIRP